MKKKIMTILSFLLVFIMGASIIGCSNNSEGDSKNKLDKITIVWYPNESGGDYEEARNAVADVVKEATGLEVVQKLTTDYSVAIESLANGTAQVGYFGPQGYVECHDKNKNVLPLVVSSGESGTLDDALYYSWLAVPKDKAKDYKDGDGYSLDNIVGKKMSFVSTSSTSGFKVPTSSIVSYFSKQDKYKDLKAEDLMEGGSDKFFSEVMYGDSHQGSAVNLLSNKCDIAAFCDTVVGGYVEPVDGNLNEVGTTYQVKEGQEDPFTNYSGEEFTTIAVTAVLNSPFVANKELLGDDLFKKVQDALTDDKVANNKKIFADENSETKGFITKKGDEHFVKVEDDWFEPIRKLSK